MSRENRKESLYLLHGWGMNRAVWATVQQRLSHHQRITALDLAGHGHAPAIISASPKESFLHPLRQALKPGYSLIGWSLGGLLAMLLSLENPADCRRLILVASSPCFQARDDWPEAMARKTLDNFSRQLQTKPQATRTNCIALQFLGSKQSRSAQRLLQQALQSLPPPQTAALQAGLSLLAGADIRAQLPQLSMPVLIIHGRHDRIVPPAAAEAMARALPNARLFIIDGAGHAPFISHPELFSSAVLDFTNA